MPIQKPVNPPSLPDGPQSRAAFREWLMEGGEVEIRPEGLPLVLWLLERGHLDAIEEAWAAGAPVDARDGHGRNWLHRAIVLEAPTWLAMEGFRRMGPGWWQPDDAGMTPLHLPVANQRLAQAMIARWWAEHRPWRILKHPFDPCAAGLPQSRAWQGWADVLRP